MSCIIIFVNNDGIFLPKLNSNLERKISRKERVERIMEKSTILLSTFKSRKLWILQDRSHMGFVLNVSRLFNSLSDFFYKKKKKNTLRNKHDLNKNFWYINFNDGISNVNLRSNYNIDWQKMIFGEKGCYIFLFFKVKEVINKFS